MLDEPTARAVAILVTALGVPALLASLGRSVWKWWTGRAGRERARNNDIVARLREAEMRADSEALEKRWALEYASALRRQLIEKGVRPEPWPSNVGNIRRDAPEPRRTTRRKPVEDGDEA